MKRNLPLRNPQNSTTDLLSWSQIRLPDNSSAANGSQQPSEGISKVLGGGQTTNEEAESLNKNVSYRKNCSGHKLKEMVGSDIFSDNDKNDDTNHTSRLHYHQDQESQISFSGEENQTPKKPTTLTEEAKGKELSRTVQTEADSKSKKKQISNAKTKAISGHDIFESPPPEADSKSKKKQISSAKTKAINGHDIFESPPPPEIQPHRFLAATQEKVKGNRNMEETAPRNLRASVKASSGQSGFSEEVVVKTLRKIHKQKSQGRLTSNGIFKCDATPPGYSEKLQSSAKLREMSGHDIFADGKSEYRDYYGGVRRPPGGESSISLV